MHYYRYDANTFAKHTKMPCVVFPENDHVFYEIAKEMIGTIVENSNNNEQTVLIVPVGPVGHYPYFVEMVNEQQIDLSQTWFINMDEYLDGNDWICQEDSLSFRKFMDDNVYSQINEQLIMPVEHRIFPDPHDIEHVGRVIEKLGKVDLVIGGIGINGHVAFNEPNVELTASQYLQLPTRIQEIAEETRVVNGIMSLNGAYEAMPTMCVTVGMKEIYSAKKIRLGVFRDWHRAVVRKALHAEPTTAFPVTLLQSHPDCLIYCTDYVAQLPE